MIQCVNVTKQTNDKEKKSNKTLESVRRAIASTVLNPVYMYVSRDMFSAEYIFVKNTSYFHRFFKSNKYACLQHSFHGYVLTLYRSKTDPFPLEEDKGFMESIESYLKKVIVEVIEY